MAFSNLVFLDLDAALEQDDANNNDAGKTARSANDYDDDEEGDYQQPQRSKENMPPTSQNRCHRMLFRIAIAASLVFIVLMMGLARRHGKSIRGIHDAEIRAEMGGNGVAASTASMSASAPASVTASVSSSGAPLVSLIGENVNDDDDDDDDDVDLDFHIDPHVQKHDVSAALVTLFGPTARPTTTAPTPYPTKAPTTPSPTQSPTGIPTASPPSSDIVCQDDPTYRSKIGMVCLQHVTLKCGAFSNIGVMLEEEVEELIRRCPVSCHVEGCVEEGGQEVKEAVAVKATPKPSMRPTLKPSAMPTARPTPKPTTLAPVTPPLVPAMASTNTRTADIVEEITGEQCPYGTDDKLYRSPLGQPCEYFREINCHMLLGIGFHVTEVAGIINACPCACEIKQGTVRLSGLATPDRPTGSSASMSPTKFPTASPTVAPTPRPTASPTISPTPAVTEDTNQGISPLIMQSIEQIQNIDEDTSNSSVHPVTVAALVVLSIVITLGIFYVVHKRKRGEKILDCISLGNDSDENSIKDALDESFEDGSVVCHKENNDPELRSCLRDGSRSSSSSERGHRRNVSWGNARVRRIERIHSDSSDSSGSEDNSHEEEAAAPPAPPTKEAPNSQIQSIREDIMNPQWPSKNELRWYNLGLLKTLGEEAMEEARKSQDRNVESGSIWNWPNFSLFDQ